MTEQILAVQRMQDYIEQHLSENITLAKLSEVSLYSPWYSYRLFKEHTNLTPADYIRRLRLSRSALRLRDEKCRILDVALDMGFGSVDGYQRAFFPGIRLQSQRVRGKPRASASVHPLWCKIQKSAEGARGNGKRKKVCLFR